MKLSSFPLEGFELLDYRRRLDRRASRLVNKLFQIRFSIERASGDMSRICNGVEGRRFALRDKLVDSDPHTPFNIPAIRLPCNRNRSALPAFIHRNRPLRNRRAVIAVRPQTRPTHRAFIMSLYESQGNTARIKPPPNPNAFPPSISFISKGGPLSPRNVPRRTCILQSAKHFSFHHGGQNRTSPPLRNVLETPRKVFCTWDQRRHRSRCS